MAYQMHANMIPMMAKKGLRQGQGDAFNHFEASVRLVTPTTAGALHSDRNKELLPLRLRGELGIKVSDQVGLRAEES